MYQYFKNHYQILIPLFIQILLLVPLFYLNRFQMDPDYVSYVSIALRYKEFDFGNAINAFYPPLYSWLLLPVLIFSIPAVFAAKFLGFFIALFVLYSSYILLKKIIDSKFIIFICLLSFISYITYFSLLISSPDLLLTGLLILYLNEVLNVFQNPKSGRKTIFSLAVIIFLIYLTKLYGLYFIGLSTVTLLIFSFIIRKYPGVNPKASSILFLGLIVSIPLILIWATIISLKIQSPTLSTLGSANFNQFNKSDPRPPYTYEGLFYPATNKAVSIAEDPNLIPALRESTFQLDSSYLKSLAALTRTNLHKIKNSLNNFSPIFMPVLISVGGLILLKILKNRLLTPLKKDFKIEIVFLIAVLYPLGYSLNVIFDRYLILNFLLATLLTFFLIHYLIANRMLKFLISLIIFASVSYYPLTESLKPRPEQHQLFEISSVLSKKLDLKGKNLASNINWNESLIIASLNEAKYLGQPNNSQPALNQLKSFSVDYYLYWQIDPPINKINGNPILNIDQCDLKLAVFKVNPSIR